ncbi:MAG: 3'-5' exonuclease, partial [Tepidisphaeraceae bacterium]
DDYAEVLRRSLIPVHSESGTGYFESMEVNDVLALLKVLDNRAQDIPLAAVLRSPIAGLPDPEDILARVRLAYPDRSIPFHQAVVRYAKERNDEVAAKLNDVIARLDRWRTLAQRRPLAELIWDVYDSTGYLAFCAGLRDGEQRKANLIDLHDRARQFGSFQRQGLSRFLAFLDQLREESDLGRPPVVSEGEDVVRIMTIHHSKGLEFPVVFIPDLGKRINLQDCAGSILVDRHAYLGMDVVDEVRQVRYPSLASTLVSSRLRRQSMAEELRVLYVAMTRAKEHLILVGTTKPDADEAWAEKWAGHPGALPADAVLGVMSMLDWIGPAAAANRTRTNEPIRIIKHDVKEVQSWPASESLRPAEGERQQRLARLEPLRPSPSPDPQAEEIIARLATEYRFAPLTKLAAVEAATAITKKGKSAPVGGGQSSGKVVEFGKLLELPRAVRTEQKASAADIGEATHLVLQHLDFAQPCDWPNLKSQISNLLDRRLMNPAAAGSVDLDSILWLIASDVGKLIRAHAATLRRELPLYLAVPPQEFDATVTSDDPQDRVMVRSRLDLLVATARGLEIVDYKTDRVTEQTLDQRVEFYRPQMELYRRAVQEMTGQPPAAVHLVFLHPRRIVTM